MGTCAGFKGSFYYFNKRLPTDQEIYSEGVREGTRRAPTYDESKHVALLKSRIQELERQNKELIEKGFVDADIWSVGSFETGGTHLVLTKATRSEPEKKLLVYVNAQTHMVTDVASAVTRAMNVWLKLYKDAKWKKVYVAGEEVSEIHYPHKEVPSEDEDGPWVVPIGEKQ